MKTGFILVYTDAQGRLKRKLFVFEADYARWLARYAMKITIQWFEDISNTRIAWPDDTSLYLY